ncbi:hypothetical protein Tco_0974248 [Tanacetum coccineum]|uniref:Uncharacterized protein n=1 Tax=Tanacetum coccineum TaxID=301880 RepID=A0ABQ5EB28_9ASTR
MEPQCSTQIHSSINTITIHPKQQSDSRNDKTEENEEEKRNSLENHFDSSIPPDPSIAFITKKVLKLNPLFDFARIGSPSPNAELSAPKRKSRRRVVIKNKSRGWTITHKEEPKQDTRKCGGCVVFICAIFDSLFQKPLEVGGMERKGEGKGKLNPKEDGREMQNNGII